MTPHWPAVIFDLDGTLIDSVGLIIDSFQYAFRTVLGHEWDEAEIKTWIGRSLRETFEQYQPDRVDELFTAYGQWNDAHTAESIRAFDGVAALLGDLHAARIQVGAATSKRAKPAHWALELSSLDAWMPLLVAHDDVATHKPDPAPLLLAAKKLGRLPSEAVYVGDARVDILAANNAHMASIGVTWGAGTRADLNSAHPTAVVDTLDELRATLLG